MEGKNETKKKEITSTTIRASKKITTSHLTNPANRRGKTKERKQQ